MPDVSLFDNNVMVPIWRDPHAFQLNTGPAENTKPASKPKISGFFLSAGAEKSSFAEQKIKVVAAYRPQIGFPATGALPPCSESGTNFQSPPFS
jgi:hypothetical protein